MIGALASRLVSEITVTAGIGDYVLSGSVPGAIRFRDYFSDREIVNYTVSDGVRSEDVNGLFLYPDRLLRTNILSSTKNGEKINWPNRGQRIVQLLTVGVDLNPISASLSSYNVLYFPPYSQFTGVRTKLSMTAAVSDSENSFRDAFYVENADSDITVYTLSHTNYAGRFAAFGPYSAGFQVTYKNIIGASFYSMGANSGTILANGVMSGCSGITAEAIQFGEGIASNEFSVQNPSAAGGSLAQSKSMAAVQAIVASNRAAADATHTAYAFLASNGGTFSATAALGAAGGQYVAFIDAGSAIVSQGGIVMPGSVANFVGTVIDYGIHNGNPAGGSWTDWKGNVNGGQYRWVDGGNVIGTLDTLGLGIVGVLNLNTALTFATLPAVPVLGMLAVITNSNTNVWGATIAGGGADNVLAFYNGTNWTVAAK